MIFEMLSFVFFAALENIGAFFGRPRRGRFTHTHVFTDERFSLGSDNRTRARYLAIPASDPAADAEEYYRLSRDEFARFTTDPAVALAFADACRARLHDDRLIVERDARRGATR